MVFSLVSGIVAKISEGIESSEVPETNHCGILLGHHVLLQQNTKFFQYLQNTPKVLDRKTPEFCH
jgi:hypothetical protein